MLNFKIPGHTGSLGRWTFDVKVTIAAVVAIATVAVVALHVLMPEWHGEFEFGVAVVGGASFIYAAFYAGQTLQVSVERQKQQNAFEMLRDTYRVDIGSLMLKVRKNSGGHLSAVDQCKKITEDESLHNSTLLLLGLFEDVSLAVQADMACEKILYGSLGFLVPNAFENLKPYILHRRREDGDNTLWVELERLAQAWKEKKSLKTGAAFAE